MPIPGDVLTPTDTSGTGGIVVAGEGSPAGSLIDGPGQLQFGPMLVADGTALLWSEITNWRGISTDFNDSPYSSSHGDRAGSILAQGVLVTFTAQLNVEPSERHAALAAIEYHTRIRDEEVALVVNDGAGAEFRMARVVARELPDTITSRLGADRPAIQFKCADPRRYSLAGRTALLQVPSSSGGLNYTPGLDYDPGLGYGTTTTGSVTTTNGGNTDTPVTAQLVGPLTDPTLLLGDRRFAFDITLLAGETLTINGRTGEVLLGTVDRSTALSDTSDLLDDFSIAPGDSTSSLLAASGSGYASLSWYDAKL